MSSPDEVYLDHNATSPLRREALEAMRPWWEGTTGNPSSPHRAGMRARAALDDARSRVAAEIGALPEEIVFTSGGTEGNNLALIGAADATRAAHIVTTAIEHPSVLRTISLLEERGASVTRILPEPDGAVAAATFLAGCEARTAIASLQWVNHETGAVHEVERIAEGVRGPVVHVDAAQAVGRVPIDLRRTPIDLLTWTAHKIGGPVGIGALFRRSGTPIHPTSYGGSQEHALRAGTPSVALAVGFATAMELASHERAGHEEAHRRLRARLVAFIDERFPDAVVVASTRAHPSTTCVAFRDVDREALLVNLDLEGIRVSAGAACASGATETSPVLRAMNMDERLASGAIRISFGASTHSEHIDRLVQALEVAVTRARSS